MKFEKLRKVLSFFLFFAASILTVNAQNNTAFTFEGIVKDETAAPIPGATVQLQGTNLGTITDIDGKFSLSGTAAEGSYNLIASFVGYAAITQSVAINASTKTATVNFDLKPDILNLDEVVVTGASPTSTRKQLGNSISVVKQDALRDAGTTNTLGALSGKVMGAQVTQNSGDPAGGFSVRLRGAGSINSSSDPLYVIDGVVVDNSSQNVINLSADTQGAYIKSGQNRLVDINPDDIEHVEVLNGAAAAAIYGSRAGNGVVQIFTKRGKSGKTAINFSTSFMVSDLRKEDAMTTYPKRFGVPSSNVASTDPTYLNATGDRLSIIRSLGFSATGLDAAGTKYTKFSNNAILINDQYTVQRYDYWKDIFTTATGTDNSLSFSGGSDKTQFFVSGGYYANDGIVKNTNFKKYTLRANIDQTLASWAKLSVNIAGNLSTSKDQPNGNNFFNPISGVFIMDNVWDLNRRDANGNLLPVERVRLNPLSSIETFNLTQATTRVIGNVKLSLYPIKGLSIDLVGGSDMYSLQGHEFHPRLPYYDAVAGNISTGFYPDGYVGVATSSLRSFNHDLLANYNTTLVAGLTSTTTVGYQIQYQHSEYGATDGNGLAPYAPTGASIANVQSIITPYTPTQTDRLISGYFAQETFGYKDQFFLTGGVRVDNSSSFGAANQNQVYPKVSGSWVLSDNWKGTSLADFLSTAKIRSAWGKAGNVTGVGEYDRYNSVALGSYIGYPYAKAPTPYANSNVKPETKTEIEVGADFAFFKNRFGLSINLYKQKVTDLLLTKAISPTVGGTQVLSNISADSTYLQNQGIELMLNASIIKQKDFKWDIGVIFNANKNKVYGIDGTIIALSTGGNLNSAISGYAYGVFYGTYYARDASGNLIKNANGLPQSARGVQNSPLSVAEKLDAGGQPTGTELRKVIGDPNPSWTGSITSSLSYKKFTFSFLIDAVYGAQINNWNRITSNNVGWGPLANQELQGLVPRGSVVAIAGGLLGGSRIYEEHIEDATFYKLREVALSYNFGKTLGFADNATLSLIGRNLFSIDNYQGFDPETSSSGQSDRIRGNDFGAVPIPRQFMLKLNVRF